MPLHFLNRKNQLEKKIGRMFTDPKRIRKTDPGHPEKCNVHNYYKIFKPEVVDEVADACRNAQIGCTECKKNLSEVVIEVLSPLQEKRHYYEKHKDVVGDILTEGKQQAQRACRATLQKVGEALGYGTIQD